MPRHSFHSQSERSPDNAAEISDDVVALFTAIGRYDQLADAVRARFGGAVDVVYASMSSDVRPEIPAEVIAEIQAIPCAFKGFASVW